MRVSLILLNKAVLDILEFASLGKLTTQTHPKNGH